MNSDFDWNHLLHEFRSYLPDEQSLYWEHPLFIRALVRPTPKFVEGFLKKAVNEEAEYAGESVRKLYFFLLEKRYTERFNLLYFAFNIFDDDTCLPEEVVNQTPFPHEDGIPRYRYALNPGFSI